jgi:hypothetical protein
MKISYFSSDLAIALPKHMIWLPKQVRLPDKDFR